MCHQRCDQLARGPTTDPEVDGSNIIGVIFVIF